MQLVFLSEVSDFQFVSHEDTDKKKLMNTMGKFYGKIQRVWNLQDNTHLAVVLFILVRMFWLIISIISPE